MAVHLTRTRLEPRSVRAHTCIPYSGHGFRTVSPPTIVCRLCNGCRRVAGSSWSRPLGDLRVMADAGYALQRQHRRLVSALSTLDIGMRTDLPRRGYFDTPGHRAPSPTTARLVRRWRCPRSNTTRRAGMVQRRHAHSADMVAKLLADHTASPLSCERSRLRRRSPTRPVSMPWLKEIWSGGWARRRRSSSRPRPTHTNNGTAFAGGELSGVIAGFTGSSTTPGV